MYFWWETRLQFSQTNMVKTRADIFLINRSLFKCSFSSPIYKVAKIQEDLISSLATDKKLNGLLHVFYLNIQQFVAKVE